MKTRNAMVENAPVKNLLKGRSILTAWAVYVLITGPLSLLLAPATGLSQGIPFTLNYPKSHYRGGTQNWDIQQAPDGVVYVANNNGLVEFDGQNWQLAAVANQTIVRSLDVGADGRIWVGAQGEFGYFRKNRYGKLIYQSLMPLLPSTAPPLGDIWHVAISADEKTYFQAGNQLIRVNQQEQIQIWKPAGAFTFLKKIGNRLLLYDSGRGLLELDTAGALKVLAPIQEAMGPVTGMLSWAADTLLLPTLNGKIWAFHQGSMSPWTTALDNFFSQNRISAAALLEDGKLALGTAQGGIVVLDRNRKPWALLNKSNGLQNNSILSLHTDRQGNLWAGTDNGIDYVMTNSPFSYLLPDGQLEGAAYAAVLRPPMAYFGTNNGLYATPFSLSGNLATSAFQRVENTQGQIWTLRHMPDNLLIGHHEGPFRLQTPLSASSIGNLLGAWTFQVPEGRDDLLIVGGYRGLYLFQRAGSDWRMVKKYPEIQESCRILAMETAHILWVAHPYRGVYRVSLSPDFQHASVSFFNAANGLPSDNFNHVFKIGQEIVFATEKGIYKYDNLRQAFEVYPLLNDFFPPSARVRYFKEGLNGEIWFAAGEEAGYLEVARTKPAREYRKRVIPFLRDKLLAGFEFIHPYDPNHVLFGTDKGFIFYDRSKKNPILNSVLFSEIAVKGHTDTLLPLICNTPLPDKDPIKIRIPYHRQNNLKFSFALPWYGHHDGLEYAWKLSGFDQTWSAWSEKSEKEYANLRPGLYAFEVKARLFDHSETAPTVYSFDITPPWYYSRLAILLYTLAVIAVLTILVVAPQKRFARERAYMTTEHQRKEEAQRLHAEAAHQELSRVRHEKLQAEIAHKNKELASTTLHLLQKGEIIHKIQEDLQRIAKTSQEPDTRKSLVQLTKVLAQDAQLDAEWEQFAQHFDQVHSEFLRRLRERHPNLTPKDQKLCAYLRMNLTSKEIAPLLNISLRGVEISRYRLRKKLNLETEANLTEYLLNF